MQPSRDVLGTSWEMYFINIPVDRCGCADSIKQQMASTEYKFIREPDDALKCAICLEVARDPHQHEECGKLFCKEYKFIREPDDALKCTICLEVARDPHQHEECGKLFCKECIEKYGRDKPCPHCRTQGSQYFRDSRSKYGESHTLLAFVLQAGWISKIFPYAVIMTREVASGKEQSVH